MTQDTLNRMDVMEKTKQFESVFETPEFLGNVSESDELEQADAFEDYDEDGETDDIYEDDGEELEDEENESDDDSESEQSSDIKKLEKRLEDKESYISQMQSQNDQLQHSLLLLQQQVDNLSNNREKAEEDSDDFEDDEFLTAKEFKEKQKLREERKKKEQTYKDAQNLITTLDRNQKLATSYITQQEDFKTIQGYAKEMDDRNDQDMKNFLANNPNNPSATYLYLKYRKTKQLVDTFKKGVKNSKKVPPNGSGNSPVNRRKKKSENTTHDSMMKNMYDSLRLQPNASQALEAFKNRK